MIVMHTEVCVFKAGMVPLDVQCPGGLVIGKATRSDRARRESKAAVCWLS